MNNNKLYSLSEEVLWRLAGQGTYREAPEALARFQEIKGKQGTPRCFYSEFDGFFVLDESNTEQFKQCLSMGSRAKPFPI